MSYSELERLGHDVRDDEALRSDVKAIGTDIDALIDFANKNGYDLTKDDLPEVPASEQLSDEDLREVVGGSYGDPYGGDGGGGGSDGGFIVVNDDGKWFLGGKSYALVNT